MLHGAVSCMYRHRIDPCLLINALQTFIVISSYTSSVVFLATVRLRDNYPHALDFIVWPT